MKKYAIFILMFLMCCSAYSSEPTGRKWWEFWEIDKKSNLSEAVKIQQNEIQINNINHFVNYNSIYDVDVEGDKVVFYAPGGITRFDTDTEKFTHVEQKTDKKAYVSYYNGNEFKEYWPSWMPKENVYFSDILDIGNKGLTGFVLKEPDKSAGNLMSPGSKVPTGYLLVVQRGETGICKKRELVDINNRRAFQFGCEYISSFAVKDNFAWLGTQRGILKTNLKTGACERYVITPEFVFLCGVAEYANRVFYADEAGIYALNKRDGRIEAVEKINAFIRLNKLTVTTMKSDGNILYIAGLELDRNRNYSIRNTDSLMVYNVNTEEFITAKTGIDFTGVLIVLEKIIIGYGSRLSGDEGIYSNTGGAFAYDKANGKITRISEFPLLNVDNAEGGFKARTVIKDEGKILGIDSFINTNDWSFKIIAAQYVVLVDPESRLSPDDIKKDHDWESTGKYLKIIKQEGVKYEETEESTGAIKKYRELDSEISRNSAARYAEEEFYERFLYNFNVKNEIIKAEETVVEVIHY